MKLWSYWRSSSAYRVRIALGLKGLAYEYAAVNLTRDGGQQHQAEFGALNPLRQVPVLEIEEGRETIALVQSMAIIEYLDERFPQPPLLPGSARDRAHVRGMAEMINSGVQPLQNSATFAELKRQNIEIQPWARLFIERGLGALERLATPRAGVFLFADSPTLADIYLVPQLYNARRYGVPLDAFPTLIRAEANAQVLPAFRAALPQAQPDAEPGA